MGVAVLFVCTGNVCRSPLAERLLRARLPEAARPVFTLASAGTRALAGYAMDAPTAEVLRALGGDPVGHVARQLLPGDIADTDLLLTAAAVHRSDIVRRHPLAMRRVFTMREFARLGAALGPLTGELRADVVRDRIAEVAAQRGHAEPVEPGADDIGDPFGAPPPVVEQCGQDVSAAVDGILTALGLPARVPG